MSLERRVAVKEILNFIDGFDKTATPCCCLVQGLRRTGKTVAMLHAMAALPDKDKAVYILPNQNDSVDDLDDVIKDLMSKGYKYFFVDEATYMFDFIRICNFFPDNFALKGARIIFSATDSLGLSIVAGDQMFGRTVTVRTTWTSWREYSNLVKDATFDDYLRCGGIFNYPESVEEYVDSAIANNIVTSLVRSQKGLDFGNYTLTHDAIKKMVTYVVADDNHQFIESVIKTLRNYEFSCARHAYEERFEWVSKIDHKEVLQRFREKFRLDNTIKISDPELKAIQRHLHQTDVFMSCPQAMTGQYEAKNLMVQSGVRYEHTQLIINAISQNSSFIQAPEEEQKIFLDKLNSFILGKLLEDNVLVDCIKTLGDIQRPASRKLTRAEKEANRRYAIWPIKLYAADCYRNGEFDMVIVDRQNRTVDIFEIKHSNELAHEQAKHLREEKMIDYVINIASVGKDSLRSRTVIYGGENQIDFAGVLHLNVEDFLNNLPDYNQYMARQQRELSDLREKYNQYISAVASEYIKPEDLLELAKKYSEYVQNIHTQKKNCPWNPPRLNSFTEWLAKSENIPLPDFLEWNGQANGNPAGFSLDEIDRLNFYCQSEDVDFAERLAEKLDLSLFESKTDFQPAVLQ